MNKIIAKQMRIQMNPSENKCISRSEARELLSGTEEFDSIIFDFDGILSIGQAFADEIYRVFQRKYPHIKIEEENMSEGVRFMVERSKNEANKAL